MKKKVALLILLSGCAVGPNYTPPENTISNEWKSLEVESPAFVSQEEVPTDWWKVFNDPLLNKYIEMAVAYNKDLLVAEANILQARGVRQMQASSLFPQVAADVNGSKMEFSKNGPIFGNPALGTASSVPGAPPPPTPIPQLMSLYNALFDVAWEIDLFGKTRRSVESARAQVESAIESRNDVLITILGEIARNYMEIRSLQKRVQLVEENIRLLEENGEIVQKNYEAGLLGKIDYEKITAELATARSELPNLVAQVYQNIYGLSILTGNLPELFAEELLVVQPLPAAPPSIAVGLRSDLLRRRPDVRQAERDLAAATADVGVAVASFYPSITLFADGGLDSLKLKKLFNIKSKAWLIGGDFHIPIFQGGQLVGNLRAARAAASAAGYNYQKTILTALEEAESAIKTYEEDLISCRALAQAAESNRTIVDLTAQRHDKGLINLLELIDTKRKWIAAEENLLKGETASLLDLISLYKALGGGWQVLTESPASSENEP